ncbi:MAG: hypothetical protein PHT75_00450 [Bacilli bacterium]|nr:hypothetical protein [Bacilli bacterium]MDD3304588.1 hypothetical protein [Bacilli bacterium]MDD4053768.1 hypothetical protein [Bacilli bacterium]MDD4411671.1 hypothetical protein [Bacilli bacterium]
MLSKEQIEEKRLRILLVVKVFLEKGCSLAEVESTTGISSSSVQRYLHDEELISLIGVSTYETIQEKLLLNKKAALSRGGKNSALNNDIMRDDLGRFTGSKKR